MGGLNKYRYLEMEMRYGAFIRARSLPDKIREQEFLVLNDNVDLETQNKATCDNVSISGIWWNEGTSVGHYYH